MRFAKGRLAVVVSALTASSLSYACGSSGSPTTPSTAAAKITISNLRVADLGSEYALCSTGNPLTPHVVIDQLVFDFQVSRGFDLIGSVVNRVLATPGGRTGMAAVANCNLEPCSAAFEAAAPPNACVISGSSTSGGAIRLYVRQGFRPSETYRISVNPPGDTPFGSTSGASNVLEATITRIPGAVNDRVAIVAVNPRGKPGVSVLYYMPSDAVGRTIEILVSFFDSSNNLTSRFQFMSPLSSGGGLSSLGSDGGRGAGPPWRVVIRLREAEGGNNARVLQYCDNSPNFAGPRCSDPPVPLSGNILTDDTREIVIPE